MQTHQHLEEERHILADWKTVVDQVFQQATHDSLTRLPNRCLFHDQLRIAVSESKRRQEIFGVLYLDLDNFKKVNELLGHDGGDHLLTAVGARLSQVMRSEETVARIGGDEFAVLVRRLRSVQEAHIVATRLLKSFAAPLLFQNLSRVVTVSIGVSLFPFDSENEEILMKNADTAMFRVKKMGGNGSAFFKGSTDACPLLQPAKKNKKNSSKKMILIVDDDPDYQLVLQKSLRKAGYACSGVASAEEALDLLRLNVPELVILDLGLRQASGIAFLQNFAKAVANGKKIPPVLVVSGHSDPEIVEFTKMLGAACFIPKPMAASEIISAVHSFMH